eukprot:6607844-Pyramimonas_sp.AAC.1
MEAEREGEKLKASNRKVEAAVRRKDMGAEPMKTPAKWGLPSGNADCRPCAAALQGTAAPGH